MATRTTRCGAALAAAAAALAGVPAAAARADIPVRQTLLPDGDIRYSVPVTVGDGPAIEAALDTGSVGLRVLKAALLPGQYRATALRRTYAFGGGAKFDGVLAQATLGVGPVRTAGPALFQLIDRVGCVAARPDCAASRVKPEDYRIAGDGYPGQGFSAILGLSLRRPAGDDSALNPLAGTGDRSWILTLPRPGDAAPGHLVVDPDADERDGFTLLKLDPAGDTSGWADAALPGCLVEEGGGQRFCGRTMIDSGAPGLSVATRDVDRPRPWGAGRKATLEIGGPDGPVSVPFVSGEDWSRRVLLHPPQGQGSVEISAGTLPYFSYAVLYDARNGTMGFKRRMPGGE